MTNLFRSLEFTNGGGEIGKCKQDQNLKKTPRKFYENTNNFLFSLSNLV